MPNAIKIKKMVADAFEICACRPIGFQNKRWGNNLCVFMLPKLQGRKKI